LLLSFFRLFGEKFFKISHYVYRYLKYFSISFLKYFFNKNTVLVNSNDFLQMMTLKNKYDSHSLIEDFPFENKKNEPISIMKKIHSYFKNITFLGEGSRKNSTFLIKNMMKKKENKVALKENKVALKENKVILKENFYLTKLLKKYGLLLNEKESDKMSFLNKVDKGALEKELLKMSFKTQYYFVGFVVKFLNIKNNKNYAKDKYLNFIKALKKHYVTYEME
jgi:hypothetical protein